MAEHHSFSPLVASLPAEQIITPLSLPHNTDAGFFACLSSIIWYNHFTFVTALFAAVSRGCNGFDIRFEAE